MPSRNLAVYSNCNDGQGKCSTRKASRPAFPRYVVGQKRSQQRFLSVFGLSPPRIERRGLRARAIIPLSAEIASARTA
jgi:hypothetical protein